MTDDWVYRYAGVVNHFYLERYRKIVSRKYDLSQGFERHHIIPQSLGGEDVESNVVNLPLRVHFLAHRVLRHALPDSREMHNAYVMMSNRLGMKSSRDYEKSKRVLSEYLRERNTGADNPLYGRIGLLSHRYAGQRPERNHSESKKGRLNPNFGKKASEETRRRMRESQAVAKATMKKRRIPKPWRTARQTDRSLRVWSLADEIYAMWVGGETISNVCRRLGFDRLPDFINKEYQVISVSLISNFKKGFHPSEDPDWVSWSSAFKAERYSSLEGFWA